MRDKPRAIERAFQLAKSGRYASVQHILKTLETEGYLRDQTDGKSLHKQLKGFILSANGSRQAPGL
jgi:hypothetical protein